MVIIQIYQTRPDQPRWKQENQHTSLRAIRACTHSQGAHARHLCSIIIFHRLVLVRGWRLPTVCGSICTDATKTPASITKLRNDFVACLQGFIGAVGGPKTCAEMEIAIVVRSRSHGTSRPNFARFFTIAVGLAAAGLNRAVQVLVESCVEGEALELGYDLGFAEVSAALQGRLLRIEGADLPQLTNTSILPELFKEAQEVPNFRMFTSDQLAADILTRRVHAISAQRVTVEMVKGASRRRPARWAGR